MPQSSPLSGRYEILGEIGRGGMSRVLKARDKHLLRDVAIKVVSGDLPSDFVHRFLREARTVARLHHPNIVTIYDAGEADGSAFIVMELLAGETLERKMRAAPKAEWPTFIPTLVDCAPALDYAHRTGVVHCDIKPSNIIVGRDSVPKILDFGIATLMTGHNADSAQPRVFAGTPAYLAPEQLGGREIGPAVDQYALAVILYRLLTAQHPFSLDDLTYRVTHAPPPPSSLAPSLGGHLDAAVIKALATDPGERFPTCDAFMTAVMAALHDDSIPEPLARLRPIAKFWRLVDLFRKKPEEPAGRPEDTVDLAAVGVTPPPRAPTELDTRDFSELFERASQTVILRQPPAERVDQETMVRAQSRELGEILERRDFESAVALRGRWLPGIEGASDVLIGFSEAARYLGAAEGAISPHVRIEHLTRAESVLFSIGNQLLADSTPAARHFPDVLERWKTYTRERRAAAQQRAVSELPNPFRAGQPLRPDQGRAVFRGRAALVRSIEAILGDADQSSSLALLGPRRCGKTSLLQMLPAMLPDCACVFFDLQDNAVSTVSEFFEALVRRAREQIRSQRHIDLPTLAGDGTFETMTRWLDQLDHMKNVGRFLVSIDEFERLEDLFPGDRRDLLRLMGLFRATIQHRHKIRLLVSGVAPFEELGPLWNDHFINVRELRIGHLDEDASVELLCRPIPEFPVDAVPTAIARQIYHRTAGQPYLLQLYGTMLINRLNDQERKTAAADDLAAIDEDALAQGRYYFSHTYHDAPDHARLVLEALARGERPDITGNTRRWLERRWLIDDDGRLRTPVLGAYIRDELGI